MAYKLNLYRGYIAICHPEEQHLNMVGVPELLSCFVVLRSVHIFMTWYTCNFPAVRAAHFVQDFLSHFLADFEMLRFGCLEVTSRCPMHSKEAKEVKSGKKIKFLRLVRVKDQSLKS